MAVIVLVLTGEHGGRELRALSGRLHTRAEPGTWLHRPGLPRGARPQLPGVPRVRRQQTGRACELNSAVRARRSPRGRVPGRASGPRVGRA